MSIMRSEPCSYPPLTSSSVSLVSSMLSLANDQSSFGDKYLIGIMMIASTIFILIKIS